MAPLEPGLKEEEEELELGPFERDAMSPLTCFERPGG